MVVNILENLVPRIPMSKPIYNFFPENEEPNRGGVNILPNPNSKPPDPDIGRTSILPTTPKPPSMSPSDYTFPNITSPPLIIENTDKPQIKPPQIPVLSPTPQKTMNETPSPNIPTPKTPDANTSINQKQMDELFDKLNKKFQDTLNNNKRDSDSNFTNISIQIDKAVNDIFKNQQNNFKDVQDILKNFTNQMNTNQNKNDDRFNNINKILNDINFNNNQNYKKLTDQLNNFTFNQDKISGVGGAECV